MNFRHFRLLNLEYFNKILSYSFILKMFVIANISNSWKKSARNVKNIWSKKIGNGSK